MIWLLWILISLAVGLVIFTFLPSEDRLGESLEGNFQNNTEAALNQLKNKVFFLEGESKKVNQLCLSIKEDLFNLKEKDLAFIIKLLEEKKSFKQREDFPGQDDLRLQEYEKTTRLLREEIEQLAHKIIELTLEVKRLREEGEEKDRFIGELKRREVQLKSY